MPKKVIIVGAGIGGLAAAALLGKQGFDVTILEKNEQCGGRARVHKENGFVFDIGPSWYLMPDVFEQFFSLFNKKPSDFFTLKRLDPNYRVFFEDKPSLDIPSDPESVASIFGSMEENGAQKFNKYMKTASYQYDIAMKEFIHKEYRSITDFFNFDIITKGLKLHIFESLDKFAQRFFKNKDLRKILEYTTVFLGGSPNNTPALYSIMSHVDFNLGVWYPMGGIGEIVKALETLCTENGVKILLNHEVWNIETTRGSAKVAITSKGAYEADIFLVNADYAHAETCLIDDEHRTYSQRYWNSRKMGPSAFLMYLGINKKVNSLLHHNLYLAPSWDEHFKSLFDKPAWPQDPSYYICCPSKTDSSVAPEGHENVFVLVPVAAGLPDTEEIRAKYFEKILSHIEKTTGESIRDNIIYRKTFARNDFISYYNAFKGTALGLSHTLFQTAIFRPSFRSKKADNLYYCGSYTHPGIGMPMVLIAAQIACDIIRKEEDKSNS